MMRAAVAVVTGYFGLEGGEGEGCREAAGPEGAFVTGKHLGVIHDF